MPQDFDVQLLVGGKLHSGWQSIRVQRGMDQLSGVFEIAATEFWPGKSGLDASIVAGMPCKLIVRDAKDSMHTLVNGYIDEVNVRHSDREHSVNVSGRDKTADLVDCSVMKGWQYRGYRVEDIARTLAAPFGISVHVDVDTGKPLPSFGVQPGESVFEALSRAAQIRAVRLQTDANGDLVITRAGAGGLVRTKLILGENILEAQGSTNLRDRFSEYRLVGQAPGTDLSSGEHVAHVKAVAFDKNMPRYRPLLIVNDTPDAAQGLTRRAQWEANVRAARSMEFRVSVVGWGHAEGLWRPNATVRLVDSVLRFDGDVLIRERDVSLDEGGTRADLELTRADAYSLLPLKSGVQVPYWDAPKLSIGKAP